MGIVLRRYLVLLVLLALLAVPLAVHQHWLEVPPRWDPWAPLDIGAQPNLLTPFKLWRLKKDPALCREVHLSNSFIATCPLAAAFAMFGRHGLQPAAQAVFGQPVVRVEHVGSYACRAIAGSQRQSQHASANALDIVGFRLRDGRHISIRRDWSKPGAKGEFLRLVHRAACDSFNTTLGPEYNAAHRDHFHVDMGLFRMCR